MYPLSSPVIQYEAPSETYTCRSSSRRQENDLEHAIPCDSIFTDGTAHPPLSGLLDNEWIRAGMSGEVRCARPFRGTKKREVRVPMRMHRWGPEQKRGVQRVGSRRESVSTGRGWASGVL
ncbi:predicted protein [Histoplasma capsulatum G186AR]|uniref:Uncharacterized protein n=1 Tax=Ajellomyces capsulatus (strain G186AR / H82 / ATCC MYA-2454 / RMSCC 2432) TaxID=447093 RepID=C0NDM5_AJECG|nr:uncharacterized protein HCBG_01968 [Histoplasma capsulatum G186AR]EEH10323.1 predicted protein [Histoplasma capsulatum G186AR]